MRSVCGHSCQPLGKRSMLSSHGGENDLRLTHAILRQTSPQLASAHEPEIDQIPPGRDLRDARCRRIGKSCARRRHRSQRRRVHGRRDNVAQLRRARPGAGGGARRGVRRARFRRDASGQQGRARRPFHCAHGLDRQGHGGSGARDHGGGWDAQTYRFAPQICSAPRELPGVPDPQPGENPFKHFEADAYWRWLAGASLPYAPGAGAMYSNLGFGLLGDALARAGGKTYATLLHERVAAPLGMLDTTTKLSDAQMPRAMTGIDLDGKEAPLWDTPAAMDASGNVFTTGDDMTKWMRWHLAVNAPAGAEVRMIDQVPYRWHDGLKAAVGVGGEKMDALGLGWIISFARGHRPPILTKAGGVAGVMTYVVLAPTRGGGVFVAVNRLNFAMFEGLINGVHDLVADLAPR